LGYYDEGPIFFSRHLGFGGKWFSRTRKLNKQCLVSSKKGFVKGQQEDGCKTLFYIFQAVHESIFPRVAATTKSNQAWDTLQIAYQGMAKVKTTKL